MMIREFHLRFSSVCESSLLFAALRKLSRLDDLAGLSVANMAWVEWPSPKDPTDPTDPTDPGMGLGLARAGA